MNLSYINMLVHMFSFKTLQTIAVLISNTDMAFYAVSLPTKVNKRSTGQVKVHVLVTSWKYYTVACNDCDAI